MSNIQINKLQCSIDRTAFKNKYDVFKIETSEKHFSKGAKIIDSPFMEKDALAVLFDTGKVFRVLMKHNSELENRSKLKKVFADTPDCKYVTIQLEDPDKIDDYILVQLLLNSLGTYSVEPLKFSNLTGHLYAYTQEGLSYFKHKGQENISQIHTLELKVRSGMILTFDVRTFTSVLLKKYIDFSKKKFEEYSQYVQCGKYCTLTRKLSDSTEPSFILRQIKNEKYSYKFLSIQDKDGFANSKMGIVENVLTAFNSKMKGICSVSFDSIAEYSSFEVDNRIKVQTESRVLELLKNKSIRIIDTIGIDKSKCLAENIIEILTGIGDVKPKLCARMSKSDLNIRIIHNADYYTGKDAHDDVSDEYTVQHITLEDFGFDANFALKTVINELFVKNDLKEGCISIVDWCKFEFDGDYTFGYKEKINDIDRFFFMTIHPDGTFLIREQENNLFESDNYNRCIGIFADENVRGTIEDGKGNINVIYDTNIRTIPQIFDIAKELDSGNTKLRGKVKRDELLTSCLDIKFYNDSKDYYYFVGTIGAGMRATIECAVNVRKISPYQESAIFFKKLLPLMNVTFVRNGQLTVVPFPFKYLREYVKIG